MIIRFHHAACERQRTVVAAGRLDGAFGGADNAFGSRL